MQSATNTLNNGSGTRADRLGSGELPNSERTLDRWFDTSAFVAPGPQKFGNGGVVNGRRRTEPDDGHRQTHRNVHDTASGVER